MKACLMSLLMAVAILPVTAALGQSADETVPVTPDDFARAETDMYFKLFASQGGFGKFYNYRDLPLENTGVRPNRDTLYSLAVFDLGAGLSRLPCPTPASASCRC